MTHWFSNRNRAPSGGAETWALTSGRWQRGLFLFLFSVGGWLQSVYCTVKHSQHPFKSVLGHMTVTWLAFFPSVLTGLLLFTGIVGTSVCLLPVLNRPDHSILFGPGSRNFLRSPPPTCIYTPLNSIDSHDSRAGWSSGLKKEKWNF